MMGDGSLSQDEINALLMGASGVEESYEDQSVFSTEALHTVSELFIPLSVKIQELLSKMTDKEIFTRAESVKIESKSEILAHYQNKIIDSLGSFSQGIQANHYYLMQADEARTLIEELTGQAEDADSESLSTSSISEFLTSLTEASAAVLGDYLQKPIQSNPINTQYIDTSYTRLPDENFIVVPYTISIGDKTFSLNSILDPVLIEALAPTTRESSSSSQEELLSTLPNNMPNIVTPSQNYGNTQYESMSQPAPIVQGVSLPNLVSGSAPQETKNIGLLMDVMMEVTVELGRTRQPIKDILSIGEGTIIELDKLAGEPVDILVNHNRIAKGEVVVIDENFGVRITEILSGADKLSER